jgi:hypothetical protein
MSQEYQLVFLKPFRRISSDSFMQNHIICFPVRSYLLGTGFSRIHPSAKKRRVLFLYPKTFYCMVFMFIFTLSVFSQSDNNRTKSGDSEQAVAFKINFKRKSIEIPCVVTMSGGVVEWILSYTGFRGYESFLQTSMNPLDLKLALIGLGYDQIEGYNMPDSTLYALIKSKDPRLQQFRIYLSWKDSTGRHKKPLESFIKKNSSEERVNNITWFFNSFPPVADHANTKEIPLISKTHRNIKWSVIEINSLYLFDYYSLVIDEQAAPPPQTKALLIIEKVKS